MACRIRTSYSGYCSGTIRCDIRSGTSFVFGQWGNCLFVRLDNKCGCVNLHTHIISFHYPNTVKSFPALVNHVKTKFFFVGSYDREAWLRTTEKGAVCSSLPFDLTKPMSSLHNRTCSLSDECAGNCEYDRMHIKLNYCGVEVLYPVCSACRYAHLLPWTFLHKWGDDR